MNGKNFAVIDLRTGAIDGWYFRSGDAKSVMLFWAKELGHNELATVEVISFHPEGSTLITAPHPIEAEDSSTTHANRPEGIRSPDINKMRQRAF